MSMPTIPDINSEININRQDAANMIATSIGMEELSLAHILNAEMLLQFKLEHTLALDDNGGE